MESHRAVRIWVRTNCATRPSVDVQSVPRLLATSPRVAAEYRNQENIHFVLDFVRSPFVFELHPFERVLGAVKYHL